MSYQVITGDAVTRLRELPAGSVDCCVTSPPYWGLRDYGCEGQLGLEATPEEYVARMVEVFRDVRRVLADHGTCWLNLGDSFASGKGTCYNPGGGENSLPSGAKETGGLPLDRGNKSTLAQSGLKPKDLVGIPWRVAFALQADGWWLRSDIIWHKCLSGGATVYAKTQKGEMPMTVKGLVRLRPETVQLWDGKKWNQAVGWEPTPRGPRELEIEFRNGERVGCTTGHRWPTNRGLLEARDLQVGDVVWTSTLPEPEQPERPAHLEDAQIGWFVGLYLAEGSMSDDAIQIASHADEVPLREPRLRDLARDYQGSVVHHHFGGNTAGFVLHGPMLHGILTTYLSGRTAHDKHLHPRCWNRSNEFLRAVLEGYLAGDGGKAENGWRIGFCANDALASDLRCLCARLGLSLRLKRATATNTTTGKRHKSWRGTLREQQHRNGQDGEIVAIRHSRARKFWSISLRDEPHVFALSCGILTGNSNPMPESVTDRPTSAHEHVFLLAKSARYWYDADAIREEAIKGASNAGRRNNSPTDPRMATAVNGRFGERGHEPMDAGRNKRNVWTIATQPYKEAHFATFPEALVEPCILAGCPAQVCVECGAPWRRVVEKTTEPDASAKGSRFDQGKTGGRDGGDRTQEGERFRKQTLGFAPTCSCGTDLPPDSWEIIASPLADGPIDDPSLITGRAGYNRERRDGEGQRPITRFEQRAYAEQLKQSPHRADMEAEAGPAFAHYLRTDTGGARPVPDGLLQAWIDRGWLEQVTVPDFTPAETRPGLVLDPFAGSGTVGLVAMREGRDFVGIELNPEYAAMARKRIAGWRHKPVRAAAPDPEAQGNLFGETVETDMEAVV